MQKLLKAGSEAADPSRKATMLVKDVIVIETPALEAVFATCSGTGIPIGS